jgi:RDD family protein
VTAPPPPGDAPLSRNPDSAADPLKDFPLRPEPPFDLGAPAPEPSHPVSAPSGLLPDRALGTAADVATSILVVVVALLAAFAARGRTPRITGLGWAALFALTVSFFVVVVPLVFFGRTVGMALAGLVARDDGAGRPLTPSQAARRWVGTVATVAGVGLPVLWTARDPAASTPADRLSGRTLVRDG